MDDGHLMAFVNAVLISIPHPCVSYQAFNFSAIEFIGDWE
jgi:hypothetical protein